MTYTASADSTDITLVNGWAEMDNGRHDNTYHAYRTWRAMLDAYAPPSPASNLSTALYLANDLMVDVTRMLDSWAYVASAYRAR